MAQLKLLERSKNLFASQHLSTCRYLFTSNSFSQNKNGILSYWMYTCHAKLPRRRTTNQFFCLAIFVLAYRLVSSCYRNDLLDVPYFERITLVLKKLGESVCWNVEKNGFAARFVALLSQHEFFVFILQEKPEHFQHVLASSCGVATCSLIAEPGFLRCFWTPQPKMRCHVQNREKHMQVHVIWDHGDDLMSHDEHLRSILLVHLVLVKWNKNERWVFNWRVPF